MISRRNFIVSTAGLVVGSKALGLPRDKKPLPDVYINYLDYQHLGNSFYPNTLTLPNLGKRCAIAHKRATAQSWAGTIATGETVEIPFFEIAANPRWKRKPDNAWHPRAWPMALNAMDKEENATRERLEQFFLEHFGVHPKKCIIPIINYNRTIPTDHDINRQGIVVYREIGMAVFG